MDRGIIMLAHAIIIGMVLYILLVYVLKQQEIVSENQSILIASILLIYMIVFGHGIPISINKYLF